MGMILFFCGNSIVKLSYLPALARMHGCGSLISHVYLFCYCWQSTSWAVHDYLTIAMASLTLLEASGQWSADIQAVDRLGESGFSQVRMQTALEPYPALLSVNSIDMSLAGMN
jgi:hypothetical protein